MIHPTAVIDPAAEIGKDVTVGPYTVISGKVTIGDGCVIGPHVCIEGVTTIGPGTYISQYASIGAPPQDLTYKGEETRVEIGAKVNVREYVTIHRGTVRGRGATTVGDGSFLMAYCHVAHDCVLAKEVIMANSAHLGGHLEIGEKAILGGVFSERKGLLVYEFSHYLNPLLLYRQSHGFPHSLSA